MLSSSAVIVALGLATSGVFAKPGPLTPSAGKAGDECTITWTADTDTVLPWKIMNIQLMTGPNAPAMTHMRTVATVDATKQTSFTWTCPEVNPPAPIYFYQFTSPANASDLQWVTRFLIAGADGSSTAATGSQGGVAFGNGAFVDPSLYNAPPSYLAGNGQLIGGSNGNGGGSSAPVPTGTGTSALPTTTVTPTGTQSQSVPSQPTSTNSEGGSAKSSITFSVITVKPTGSGTSKSASPSTTTASASGASSLVSMSSPWGVLLGALIAGVTAAASL